MIGIAFIRRHLLLTRLRVPSHFVCWANSAVGASLVYFAAWGMRSAGVIGWWHGVVGPLAVFSLLLHIHYRSRRTWMREMERMATIAQAAERLREALTLLRVVGASEVQEALDHITWVLKDALPDMHASEAAGGAELHRDRYKQLEDQVRNALTVLHHLDVVTTEGYRERAVASAILMLEKGLAK